MKLSKAYTRTAYFVVVTSPTATDPSQPGLASCYAGPVAAGAGCIIPVTFAPVAGRVLSGNYTDTLAIMATVQPAAPSAPAAVAVTIKGVPLSATDIPWVSYSIPGGSSVATAAPVGLSAAAGNRATQAITLTNETDATLTPVTDTLGGSSVFTVANGCSVLLGPGAPCTVTVTFAPPRGAAAGTLYTGALTITDGFSGTTYYYSLTGTIPAAD
jgi:hypothetical protein